MAQIVHLTQDANDWSEWDSGSGCTCLITAVAAGLNGTAAGIEQKAGSGAGFPDIQLSALNDLLVTVFRIGFYYDTNTLVLNPLGGLMRLFTTGVFVSGFIPFIIEIREDGAGDFVRVTLEQDSGGPDIVIGSAVIPTGEITVEVVIEKPTTTASNDGVCTIYINSIQSAQNVAIDNFDGFDEMLDGKMQLFTSAAQSGVTSGSLYFDEIIIRDDSTPIFPVTSDGPHVWLYRTEDGGVTWSPSRVKTTEFGYFTGEI